MLKSGFHRSFEELFTLIEQRRKQRIEAGEDSILWQVSLKSDFIDQKSGTILSNLFIFMCTFSSKKKGILVKCTKLKVTLGIVTKYI